MHQQKQERLSFHSVEGKNELLEAIILPLPSMLGLWEIRYGACIFPKPARA